MRPILRYHKNALRVMSCAVLLYFSLANAEITDIADQCDGCHGDGGVSTESDVPSVAGISPFIIEEYMLEFRDEARICRKSEYRSGDLERPTTDMCVIAKDMSAGEIAKIAEYYGRKEFTAAKQSFDLAKAKAGATLHKRHCKKCHADGGSYADDDASILAGQWMPYLEQVFADYVTGDRIMLEDKMKEKMSELTDEEEVALIHFYGSQQ